MNEVLDIAAQAFGLARPWLEAATLIFLRVGAAVFTLPGFGERTVSPRIRLMLALILTSALVPGLIPMTLTVPFSQAFAPEILIGVFLGLSFRFFIFALITAGSIIANSTSMAQLFSQGADPQPVVASLLSMAGLALAVQADLLPKTAVFLSMSYQALPAGLWPNSGKMAEWLSIHADTAFALGFQLSLPFVIGALLYNLALGAINRAMPQLMVTFIGAPALSLGGLALLAVATPLLLSVWLEQFSRFVGNGFP